MRRTTIGLVLLATTLSLPAMAQAISSESLAPPGGITATPASRTGVTRPAKLAPAQAGTPAPGLQSLNTPQLAAPQYAPAPAAPPTPPVAAPTTPVTRLSANTEAATPSRLGRSVPGQSETATYRTADATPAHSAKVATPHKIVAHKAAAPHKPSAVAAHAKPKAKAILAHAKRKPATPKPVASTATG
jgi:hypothetical protein